ncbi:MAG: tRNA(Ile)-lysidine synthase [Lysobacterales bacterium]|jgi:tRNA(Ile)-lysidine synthase
MTQRTTPFKAERLPGILKRFPECPVYWVGFSGGADSTALLLALSELKSSLTATVKAIHFNHGLHVDSDAWQIHCEAFCRGLNIEFQAKKLYVNASSGNGIEAEARRMRYEHVERLLGQDEVFLTAHHQDDQTETLILNLIRGSGVDGLAGMPESRPLGQGLLIRPLLSFPGSSLRHYLAEHQIIWLEDPSNEDLSYDRNFIRQQFLPMLSDRWPAVSTRIAKSADLCRHASSALAQWAGSELYEHLEHAQVLNLSQMKLDEPEFALLFRKWLQDNGAPSLPARQMEQLRIQCAIVSTDNRVKVSWSGWVLHLFQNRLWIQNEATIASCPTLDWNRSGALNLGKGLGTLNFLNSEENYTSHLSVQKRTGGEKIQVSTGGQNTDLKELFRLACVPPWLRTSVPLLFDRECLVAVGDLIISKPLNTWLNDRNASLSWEPSDPLLLHTQMQYRARVVDHSGAVS